MSDLLERSQFATKYRAKIMAYLANDERIFNVVEASAQRRAAGKGPEMYGLPSPVAGLVTSRRFLLAARKVIGGLNFFEVRWSDQHDWQIGTPGAEIEIFSRSEGFRLRLPSSKDVDLLVLSMEDARQPVLAQEQADKAAAAQDVQQRAEQLRRERGF